MARITVEVHPDKLQSLVQRLIDHGCSFSLVQETKERPEGKPLDPMSQKSCRLTLEKICETYTEEFTKENVEALMPGLGFATSTAGPVLSALFSAGYVTRRGTRGSYVYALVEKS